MPDDNIVKFPPGMAAPDLLVGPFKEYRVMVDSRIIPDLTGRHNDDGSVDLIVDNRFSITVPGELAYQVAWLVAQGMAIGAGYPHLGADSKDQPFAPKGTRLDVLPQ